MVLLSGSWNMSSELFSPSDLFLTAFWLHWRIIYQNDINRVSACPVTVHSLLHVADGIEAAGPVWVYWAFVMERYCGFLKHSGVWNRRNPYKSLDQRVLNVSRLHILKLKYGLMDVLPPKQSSQNVGDIFPEHKFAMNSLDIWFILPRSNIHADGTREAYEAQSWPPLKGHQPPGHLLLSTQWAKDPC